MVNDPYRVYCISVAVKSHFTSKYDIVRYGAKVKASRAAFEAKGQAFHYNKLARKFPIALQDVTRDETVRFFVAHAVDSDNTWIGPMVSEQGMDLYRKWCDRQSNLLAVFQKDLETLTINNTFKQALVASGGGHPLLIQLLISKSISPETLLVLDQIVPGLFTHLTTLCKDMLWDRLHKKLIKYKPFVHIEDKRQMIEILRTFTHK